MPFTSGQDLKNDILFRAGETTIGTSGWNVQAMNYLNRAYRSLCAGSSEYLPQIVTDWWWMRESGVLTLEGAYEGSISLAEGSAAATLSSAPSFSLLGYRLRIQGHADTFVVTAHTASDTAVTLDSPYTGDTDSGAAFTAMKTVYPLAAAASALISPMIGFREVGRIRGMAPERLDDLYPLSSLQPGAPSNFSLDTPTTVRFSHGGLLSGKKMRVEYRYKPVVDDLTDSPSSIPIVPIEYRHVLSDMALTYVFIDKNDDRAAAATAAAKSTLAAMVSVNTHNMAKMSGDMAQIYPRAGKSLQYRLPKRTESGLIIG